MTLTITFFKVQILRWVRLACPISQSYFVVFLSWQLLYMLSPAPSSLRNFLPFHRAGLPPFPLPSETHILFWLLLSMCSPRPIILSIKPLNPLTRDHPLEHPHIVTFKVFCFIWSVCEMATFLIIYYLKNIGSHLLYDIYVIYICIYDKFLMNISWIYIIH